MKEAGWDWTDAERLASDRKGWKRMVKARMDVLYKCAKQMGRKYEKGEYEKRVNREVKAETILECMCNGCGKVCRSKAALTVRQKRMQKDVHEQPRFPCVRCDRVLQTEVQYACHLCISSRHSLSPHPSVAPCIRLFTA